MVSSCASTYSARDRTSGSAQRSTTWASAARAREYSRSLRNARPSSSFTRQASGSPGSAGVRSTSSGVGWCCSGYAPSAPRAAFKKPPALRSPGHPPRQRDGTMMRASWSSASRLRWASSSISARRTSRICAMCPPGPSCRSRSRAVSAAGDSGCSIQAARQWLRAFSFAPAASCASPAIRWAAAMSARTCPPRIGWRISSTRAAVRGPATRRSIVWRARSRSIWSASTYRSDTCASSLSAAPADPWSMAQSAAMCRARSASGPPSIASCSNSARAAFGWSAAFRASALSHRVGASAGLRGRNRKAFAARPACSSLKADFSAELVKYGASSASPMAGPRSTASTSGSAASGSGGAGTHATHSATAAKLRRRGVI